MPRHRSHLLLMLTRWPPRRAKREIGHAWKLKRKLRQSSHGSVQRSVHSRRTCPRRRGHLRKPSRQLVPMQRRAALLRWQRQWKKQEWRRPQRLIWLFAVQSMPSSIEMSMPLQSKHSLRWRCQWRRSYRPHRLQLGQRPKHPLRWPSKKRWMKLNRRRRRPSAPRSLRHERKLSRRPVRPSLRQ